MKRVAVYCRVSTDSEDQRHSFESQQRYFAQYIRNHADWRLVEIFADEDLSGTSTAGRIQFLRMIERARKGEFDLIVTKEVSRFARNTVDTLQYTRELRRLGVGVRFVNDGLDTLEPDAELRLSILSCIAQEESRRTSERVQWGQQRSMERGVVFGRSLLGYEVRGGVMTVEPEGAEIVRRIFALYTREGLGAHAIAKRLREEGVPPRGRITRWSEAIILRILRNEKYCGDLVQKKTYTPDYLTHGKKYNRGQRPLVVLRGHHTPIVSREEFELAQRIRESRRNGRNACPDRSRDRGAGARGNDCGDGLSADAQSHTRGDSGGGL